ncbi:hypothetical protein PTMSG1_10021 [Pyrenophora teres f. maculata]|nr:hypothetical protein PTMSG1_10021 [Pyrenophora teres f. maculata]
MSAPTPEPTEEDRAPSYETARTTHPEVLLTHDAQRLFWTLSSPLTSAISVMEDKWHDPDVPLEPYCVQIETSLIWHSIAQSPLTEPKISSVTVSVEQLDDWEEAWWELRQDNDDIVPVGTAFESDEDDDEDSDPDDRKRALRSCYAGMPRDVKATLDVRATGNFITVHDYVSAVHPWLVGLREQILKASGDLLDDIPLPGNTRFVVDVFPSPDCVSAVEEGEWKRIRDKKKHEEDMRRLEAYEQKKKAKEHEAYMQDQGW